MATMKTWKIGSENFNCRNGHYKCLVPDWYNNVVQLLQAGKFTGSPELLFTIVFVEEDLDDSDIQTT